MSAKRALRLPRFDCSSVIAISGLVISIVAGWLPALAQAPLKVAVDRTFAPFAYPDPGSGALQGFNIDLMRAVGRRLGRTIDIVEAPSDTHAQLLQDGSIDTIAAPPLTVTPQRASAVLFSEPYLDSDIQLLVRADRRPMATLSDFAGGAIAVAKGSQFEDWARGQPVGWRILTFGTQAEATRSVIAGQADATVTLSAIAAWIARQTPALKLSHRHRTGLVWAFPVRQGKGTLRDAIDAALECLKHNGTLATLHEKWLGILPHDGSSAATTFTGAGVPGFPGFDAGPRGPPCH